MANVLVDRSTLESLGAAIRAKNGSDKKYLPSQMAEAIDNLEITNDEDIVNQIITGSIKNYTNNTITSIPAYLFASCDKLVEINLPALIEIGDGGFYNTGLTELNLPTVTTIGQYAFQLSKLQSVQFPKVTSIPRYCFATCTQLISVNIPIATEALGYAFYQTTGLKKIKLEKVKTVGGNCFSSSGVECVDLPIATELSGTGFQHCTNLKALIIRTNSVCKNANSWSFTSSLIEDSDTEGFIYVPKTLVSSYKTATNWSLVANKIRAIEDYPSICG